VDVSGLAEVEPAQDRDEIRPELQVMAAELRRAHAETERARDEMRHMRAELRRVETESKADERELVGFGAPVLVEAGNVVDEVVGFGDDVHVEGEVLGDATSFGGSVIIGPDGIVHGDAVSFGGHVQVEDGGTVHGGRLALGVPGVGAIEVRHEGPAAMGALTGVVSGESLFSRLYHQLILLLSFAGAGVLVVGLFPSRVGRIANHLESSPFRSGLVGVIATGSLALFSLLFAVFTLGLGLPVSMMIVAVLGLAWLMGFVGLCQAVGDRLPFEQKPHGRWLAFLVGALLLTCVGNLPVVGWLVVIAASTMGIGAALSSRLGGR
jgi:hypothetical protein